MIAGEWIYPQDAPAPLDVDLLLLLTNGRASVGKWGGWLDGCVAWQFLPKRNAAKELAAIEAAMSWE